MLYQCGVQDLTGSLLSSVTRAARPGRGRGHRGRVAISDICLNPETPDVSSITKRSHKVVSGSGDDYDIYSANESVLIQVLTGD